MTVKTEFRICRDWGSKCWFAWSVLQSPGPGPHQCELFEAVGYSFIAVRGRTPFEALNRLKRQLGEEK
jgi:hypothetical protein